MPHERKFKVLNLWIWSLVKFYARFRLFQIIAFTWNLFIINSLNGLDLIEKIKTSDFKFLVSQFLVFSQVHPYKLYIIKQRTVEISSHFQKKIDVFTVFINNVINRKC